MKKRYYLAIPILLMLYSCDTFVEATEEKQFVWNGLNLWYYWQNDVPDLADNRFSDEAAFHDYLGGFSSEVALFDALKHQLDDFSWFIDNYEVHEQARQGISRSLGVRYGLVRMSETANELFGYVQYVLEGSPADEAGLKRGDIFNRVNGSQLTLTNYTSLLQNESITLTKARIEGNGFNEIGSTEPMKAVVLQENPVYLADVIEAGSKKVGYLVYNSFRFNYHEELNDAFALFKNEQVDELVVDLRYNGGGTVVTSAMLAGMISGLDEESIYARLIHNDKLTERNSEFDIYSEVPLYHADGTFDRVIAMNQLNLSRLFVLTGTGTASASESLMNGLKPYMEVIQIGAVTTGKDEGSITVYDNPPNYNSRDGANLNNNHMRAMQPVVFKIFNDRYEDYPDGFFPLAENELYEHHHLDDIRELGDTEELLLARALAIITGTGQIAKQPDAASRFGELIFNSNELEPFHDEMYLLPGKSEK